MRGILSLGVIAAMHEMVNAHTKEERMHARAIVRQALGTNGRPSGTGPWWRHAPAFNEHAGKDARNAAKARRRRLRATGTHP